MLISPKHKTFTLGLYFLLTENCLNHYFTDWLVGHDFSLILVDHKIIGPQMRKLETFRKGGVRIIVVTCSRLLFEAGKINIFKLKHAYS